jgi:hypothetical protein
MIAFSSGRDPVDAPALGVALDEPSSSGARSSTA